MAIITEKIGKQGFELVGERIAQILAEEVSNQMDIQNFEETVDFYLERIEPFSKEQDVMISVAFREADYEGFTTRDSQGNYIYFIDLFCSSMGIGNTEPSTVSKEKLFRYLGLIRYILSSSKYLKLGFPDGLIGGKYIKKITLDTDYSNFGNHSNYDGSFIRFARIMYHVRVQENQALWDGISLDGNNTNITYNESASGTQLIFNK